MHILILFSLLGFSLAKLTSYSEFLVYAAKNHYKSVSDYAVKIGFTNFDAEFEKFKIEYNRHYANAEEEEMRKFYFLKTLEFIEEHNKLHKNGERSHDVGINQFADWTDEERHHMLNTSPSLTSNFSQTKEFEPTLYDNLPASFDWRQRNKVTPVKSQGQCGACWAFATTATIEAHYAIKHNQFISLSEQQLVDCATGSKYKNGGCKGGWVPIAYQYVIDNGIETEQDYPYHTAAGNCINSPQKSHYRMNGFQALPRQVSDLELMAAIFNHGPVAINIDASGNDFGFYKNGILSTGNRNCNHYVTAVGWGSQNNVNYWIVKNSWGTQWGEGGYARMIRGQNIRNFNEATFYPLVN